MAWCTPTPGWPTCSVHGGSVPDRTPTIPRFRLVPGRVLAAAVSFFEHSPDVPGLVGQLADRVPGGAAEPSAGDEAEIWTFILFRRLLLVVAWLGSHLGLTSPPSSARDIRKELATWRSHI